MNSSYSKSQTQPGPCSRKNWRSMKHGSEPKITTSQIIGKMQTLRILIVDMNSSDIKLLSNNRLEVCSVIILNPLNR